MRGFFSQPKPRHFTHRPLFFDERKERMRLLREQSRREGEPRGDKDDGLRHERLGLLFAEAARRRQERRRRTMAAAWLWGAITALAASIALLLLGI